MIIGKSNRKLDSAMSPLYKYCPKSVAETVCATGRIRLGTLYSYRDVETLGSDVGDRHEGQRVDWSHDPTVKRGDQLNAIERQAMRIGSGMIVSNNYVQVRVNSPDCYILCLSRVLDRAVAAGLSNQCSETYDACIEVVDVDGLLRAISEKIHALARFEGIAPCVYGSRRRRYDEPEVHPALLKDPHYSYQSEVRAFWSPTRGVPEPLFVEIEDSAGLLRMVPNDWNAESNKRFQADAASSRG